MPKEPENSGLRYPDTHNAKIKRMFLTAIVTLVAGYVLLMLIVYMGQDRMVYFPEKDVPYTPADIGLFFEDITIITKDGISLSAWFIPSEHERAVLLFCHGNAGNISHRLDSIRTFHSLQMSVLIFDYRGYGKSNGIPSERGLYYDADSAYEYLVTERLFPPEKIILFGRSLGSAVAAETALKQKAGALILESGFTSLPDLGNTVYPYLPVRLLSRYQYATIDKIGNIRIPKLFIHSPQDEIIPFAHGETLFNKAKEPKDFLEIAGGHNEGFMISGEIYKKGLNSFLAKYFPAN